MDNYEAIMKMNKQQLGAFLDGVYCTGLNDGMYATLLPEDKADEILAKNPYGEEWLSSPAEKAVLQDNPKDEEKYMLDSLAAAVLRNAGIDEQGNIVNESGNTIVLRV